VSLRLGRLIVIACFLSSPPFCAAFLSSPTINANSRVRIRSPPAQPTRSLFSEVSRQFRPAHITDFVITRDRLSSRNHRSKISPHIPRPGKYPSRHYAISGDCMQMVKRTREYRKDCPHSRKWLDTNTTVASVKLRTSPVTRGSPYVIFTRSQRGWYAIFEPSPGGPYVIFGRSPLWRISE
jgi:hypothetical protein